MKLLTATAAALLALTFTSHARLDDTEGVSQQRYGAPREDLLGAQDKPLIPGAVERQYMFEGFRVRAAFAGGTCKVIEYAHIPENNIPKALTAAETKAILAAEQGKWKWKEEKVKDRGAAGDIARGIQEAFKLNKWERTDGAIAEFALGLVLKISAKDADDWAKRIAREAKKAPVKPGPKPVIPAPLVPKF